MCDKKSNFINNFFQSNKFYINRTCNTSNKYSMYRELGREQKNPPMAEFH